MGKRVIITKRQLIEYLQSQGHNVDGDVSFTVLGASKERGEVNVCIGDGAHLDDDRPIVADWVKPKNG